MSRHEAVVGQAADCSLSEPKTEHALTVVGDSGWLAEAADPLEEALAHAQANLLRYQDLFDSAPIGYIVTDERAVIQEVNQAAAHLLGYHKFFLVDKPLLFCVDQADRAAFLTNLLRLRNRSASGLECELTFTPPRDEPRHVLASAAAARPVGGGMVIRWTLRDISERWQYERTLRTEKKFSESLVELAGAVVLVLDAENRVIRTNDYTAALVGCERQQLEGRTVEELQQEFQITGEEKLTTLHAKTGRGEGVHRLVSADGTTRTLAWTARALPSPDDGRSWTLVVGSDITELQDAQRRAAQVERLAEIGQLLASVAHESGNALQRINVSLELLRLRLAEQPDNMQLLEIVCRANGDLQRLQERVRASAAPIRLEVQLCELAAIWREAWDDLRHLHANRAELHEELAAGDSRCLASPFHLKQVFRNLLENALSIISGSAKIAISCRVARLDGREALEVTVRDNGPGFGPEQRQKAFEPFYTTKTSGTGLGLPLCKRLIEAHGGRIDLGAENGPGGVVIITLPRFG